MTHQSMGRLCKIRHQVFFHDLCRYGSRSQCSGHITQLECRADHRHKQVAGFIVRFYLGEFIRMGTNDFQEIWCRTWEGFACSAIEPASEYCDTRHREGET